MIRFYITSRPRVMPIFFTPFCFNPLANLHHFLIYVFSSILWNNQQMSQRAVKFYFSASPLYMFRAAHTPIIRSTATGTIHSQSQIILVTSSQRSLPGYAGRKLRLYSWWWACVPPETCRVDLQRNKTSLHIVTSVGYSIEYYDARNNKYQVNILSFHL